MAIKTKIRTTAISGSVPGSDESAAAAQDLAIADLDKTLDHMASAIKRIHGSSTFSENAAGVFSQNISVVGTTPMLTIGDNDAEDVKLKFNSNGSDFQIGVDADENSILRISTSDFDTTAEVAELSAALNAFVGDVSTAGTFLPTGDTAANDAAAVGYHASEGIIITGQGNTSDVTLKNDADATVLSIPTGTTNVDVVGDLIAGKLRADGDTAAGDDAAIGYTAAEGIIITGQGSVNDVTIKNDLDAVVMELPTGTTAMNFLGNVDVVGDVTGGVFMPDGDTAADDAAAVGYTAAEGIIITGQGSTNDVTIKNDADADVLVVPTGTTNVDIVGVATAATFEPDGDTSAGDNAAIGYTASEGLILTGQGSNTDVVIKNDADQLVLAVATGTQNVEIIGDLTVTGNDISGDSAVALTLDGANVEVKADLTVTGGDIKRGSAAAMTIGGDVGANSITIGQSNSTVVVAGNLDVNGTTTTIDTTNMSIEDRIIGLGVSGSGGPYSNLNTGIVFGYGEAQEAQAGLSWDGAVFQLAKSTTSPLSASFAVPAAADYTTLLVGRVEPGAANTYDLGSTAKEWRHIYIGDDSKIYFGSGQDASIEYDEDGTDELRFAGAAATFEQAVSFDGAVTLGNQTSDDITVTGRLVGSLVPKVDANSDLGTSLLGFNDLHLGSGGVINLDGGDVTLTHAAGKLTLGGDGTVEFDFADHEMTNVDINSGAIDGTVVGAASAAAGTFTALDCNDGAFAIANLDIDGGTDIGADLVDADEIIVDDGGNGTNRRADMSRVKTYVRATKFVSIMTATLSAGSKLATGITTADFGAQSTSSGGAKHSTEVYVNGQLMLGGDDASANNDYYEHGDGAGNLAFEFGLEVDDVVQVFVR